MKLRFSVAASRMPQVRKHRRRDAAQRPAGADHAHQGRIKMKPFVRFGHMMPLWVLIASLAVVLVFGAGPARAAGETPAATVAMIGESMTRRP